jgi:putative ABC transport system permease protein
MNIFTLSYYYLTHRLHNSLLNIFMMATGIMLITILLLTSYQIQNKLIANSDNIDVVVGAKGSPVQLILSTIYHIDIATGNISSGKANKLAKHPHIKQAIPISLGDNYQNFRIIGTRPAYLENFQAIFASGRIWQNPMEAVIGAKVAQNSNLKIGDYFAGHHGAVMGGEIHQDHSYKVVGILQSSNNILDRLIITSLDSVWNIHQPNNNEEHEEHRQDERKKHHEKKHRDKHKNHHHEKKKHEEHRVTKQIANYSDQEITALLIKYKYKRAALTFPRYVNQKTNMQAASPAFTMNNLMRLMGFGKDTIVLFASFLIILSLIHMLIGLFNAVSQRRYDLAIFRVLGASKSKIFIITIIEAMIITILGTILGLVFGHIGVEIIGNYTIKGTELGLTGWIFLPQIFILWFIILISALFIAAIPAIRAYKTNIRSVLTNDIG